MFACSSCINFTFYNGSCLSCPSTKIDAVCSACTNFALIGTACVSCDLINTATSCLKCLKYNYVFDNASGACFYCPLAQSLALCSQCSGFGFVNQSQCMPCNNLLDKISCSFCMDYYLSSLTSSCTSCSNPLLGSCQCSNFYYNDSTCLAC